MNVKQLFIQLNTSHFESVVGERIDKSFHYILCLNYKTKIELSCINNCFTFIEIKPAIPLAVAYRHMHY